MKSLAKYLLAFVFVLATTVSAQAEKTYINGIDANYPPFGYVNEKGEPDGFDVKAIDWIAKEMGFKVVHQPMDWDGIIPSLLSKKIDLIASGMSISPEREAQVAFTDPYWTFATVLVGKEGTKLTVDETFNGKTRIGVQRGTTEHTTLDQKKIDENLKYTLRYYDSAPLAIEDLINGRLDAAAMDSFPANDAIAKGKKIQVIGTFGPEETFGVATRKEDVELRKMIDEGYKKLQNDPYWDELNRIYVK